MMYDDVAIFRGANLNLFAFYVGGKTETSYIEVHDVRFAIGDRAEDCYASIRNQWWGTKKSLHIDCHGILESVDGYDIELKREPYTGSEKLYFLNLGGYDPNDFSELHRNVFVVAESDDIAKDKAIKGISRWQLPHKDNLLNVESIISLSEYTQFEGLHIHLTKNGEVKPFRFASGYTSLTE